VLTVALAVAVIGVAIVATKGGAIGGVRRFSGMTVSRQALVSLWDRFGYGSIATRMIREYPLTGVGIGTFPILAPDYWRMMTAETLPFDNAQNWWRHEAAELGMLGAIPLFLWSLVVVRLVVLQSAVDGRRREAAVPRGLLLGIGVISLLGVPTQNAFVLLWFLLAVAWLFATVNPPTVEPQARSARLNVAWAGVTAMAVGYAAVHLVLARGPLSVLTRASRANRDYVIGAYSPEHLPNFQGDFLWTRQHAHLVLPAKQHPLIIRLWASHPDVTVRPVRVTVSSPCGVMFDTSLTTGAPVDLGLTPPKDLKVVNLDVAVSRTWQPSAFDRRNGDTRHLGVAVQTDFNNRGPRFSDVHRVAWPCAEPGA
jgi:hypothetical protein